MIDLSDPFEDSYYNNEGTLTTGWVVVPLMKRTWADIQNSEMDELNGNYFHLGWILLKELMKNYATYVTN